jgi:uncharacterized protein YbjT (DUF2867 family)
MTGLVTVFGGDGFIGRYAVQALLKAGWRVRISCRTTKRSYFLKAQANLGQIGWMPADVLDPSSVASACEGADAVVNLVGSFANMDAIHGTGARNIAQAAAAAGVSSFVQMSAIGADPESPSTYGRSKAAGEAAVLEAIPGATILRPSVVFGREDEFINRFAGLIRMMPVMPIIGGKTRFQPVFVGDVGHAVAAALAPMHRGKTFTLGGPEILSMAEINRWIAAQIGRKPMFIDVPDQAAALMARLTGSLPGAPMSWDQWLMLQKDNVVPTGADDLKSLGITPTAIDLVSEDWLVKYRKHGRFAVGTDSK